MNYIKIYPCGFRSFRRINDELLMWKNECCAIVVLLKIIKKSNKIMKRPKNVYHLVFMHCVEICPDGFRSLAVQFVKIWKKQKLRKDFLFMVKVLSINSNVRVFRNSIYKSDFR